MPIQIPDADPTQSKTKRKRFEAKFNTRWREVRGEIRRELSNGSDLLPNSDVDTSIQVSEFRGFIEETIEDIVIEPTRRSQVRSGMHYTAPHVRELYEHGVEKADSLLRSEGYEFRNRDIDLVMSNRLHDDAVRTEYLETYQELEDIGRVTERESSRTYRDAAAIGLGAGALVSALNGRENGRIRKIGETRTGLLAHSQGVKTINDAALNRYEEIGVSEVGVNIEVLVGGEPVDEDRLLSKDWLTAGDPQVCSLCMDFAAGAPYRIEEIRRGEAPMPIRDTHPVCRCMLAPT